MTAGPAYVMHRGALGDSVLLWPLLRALKRDHTRVVLVSDLEKSRLASRATGVEAESAEQHRYMSLWFEGGTSEVIRGVSRVVSFVVSPCDASAHAWVRNAGALFPGSDIRVMPGRPDRALALEYGGDQLPARGAADGPIVLHAGAGSPEKAWPLERWLLLARDLLAQADAVALIAGEAEQERWSEPDRNRFTSADGRFLGSLSELYDVVAAAYAFVGADTGAGHLAAQLGVPTLSLFGPSDPEVWAPVGPVTRVLRAPGGHMLSIGVADIRRELADLTSHTPARRVSEGA